MDITARHTGPDRNAQQQAARRFGMALVASALAVAGLAFAVREIPSANSAREETSAAGVLAKASNEAPAGARYRTVLDAFVEALQREDDAAMRSVYPALSDRDARVLHAVRRRIGGNTLHVASVRLATAQPDKIEVVFLVVADGAKQQTRLPFDAKLARAGADWRIVELH